VYDDPNDPQKWRYVPTQLANTGAGYTSDLPSQTFNVRLGNDTNVVLNQLHISDSFDMYIMFRPNPPDACWIPLKKLHWWWNADYLQFVAPKGVRFTKIAADQDKVVAIDTTEHPTWDLNLEATLNTWIQN
jgi:hypothetical protein